MGTPGRQSWSGPTGEVDSEPIHTMERASVQNQLVRVAWLLPSKVPWELRGGEARVGGASVSGSKEGQLVSVPEAFSGWLLRTPSCVPLGRCQPPWVLCKSPVHIKWLLSHSCFPLSLFCLPGDNGQSVTQQFKYRTKRFPYVACLERESSNT